MSSRAHLTILALFGILSLVCCIQIVQLDTKRVQPTRLRTLQEAKPVINCDGEQAYSLECVDAAVIEPASNIDSIKTLNPERDQQILLAVVARYKFDLTKEVLEPADQKDTFLKKFDIKQDQDALILDLPANQPELKEGVVYKIKLSTKSENDKNTFVHTFILEFGFKLPTVRLTWEIKPSEAKGYQDPVQFIITLNGAKSNIKYALGYHDHGQIVTIENRENREKSEGNDLFTITYNFPIPPPGQASIKYSVMLMWYVEVDQDQYAEEKTVTITRPSNVNDDFFLNEVKKIKNKGDGETYPSSLFVSLTNSIHNNYSPDIPNSAFLDTITNCDDTFCGGKTQASPVYGEYCACVFPCEEGFDGPTCQISTTRLEQVIQLYRDILEELPKRSPLGSSNVGDYTEVLKTMAKSRHIYSNQLTHGIISTLQKAVAVIDINSKAKDVIEDIFYVVETIDIGLSTEFYAVEGVDSQPEPWVDQIKSARDVYLDLMKRLTVAVGNGEINERMYKSGIALQKYVSSEEKGQVAILTLSQNIRTDEEDVETITLEVPFSLMNLHQDGKVELAVYALLSGQSPYDLASGDDLNQLTGFITFGILEQRSDDSVTEVAIPSAEPDDMIRVIFNKFTKQASENRNLLNAHCAFFDESALNWIVDENVCKTRVDTSDTSRVECDCSLFKGKVSVVMRNRNPTRPIPCFGETSAVPECHDIPVVDQSDLANKGYRINPAVDDFLYLRALVEGEQTAKMSASLSLKYHDWEQNKTLFENAIVRQQDMTQLDIQFPKTGKFTPGTYRLRVAILVNTKDFQALRIQEIDFEIIAPTLIIEANPEKKEGTAFRDRFSINFNVKRGEGVDKDYSFDYTISLLSLGRVTLAVGLDKTSIDPVSFTFPLARTEEAYGFAIEVYYRVGETGFEGKTIVEMVANPPVGLKKEDVYARVEDLEKQGEKASIRDLLFATLDYITTVTPNDQHHSEVSVGDQVKEDGSNYEKVCREAFCNNQGKCVDYLEYTHCQCDDGYSGPTCAFTPDSQVTIERALSKILDTVAKKDNITPERIDAVTEIFKAIASNRHIFSFELAIQIGHVIDLVVGLIQPARLKDTAILEDIFFSVESLTHAINSYYLSHQKLMKIDDAWLFIEQLRGSIRILNSRIVTVMKQDDEFVFATNLYGETLNTTIPSQLKEEKPYSSIILRMAGPKRDAGGGVEEVYITFSNKYLAELGPADMKVTIVGQLMYSNPYTIITGDYYVHKSSIVNLRLINQEKNEEIYGTTDKDDEFTYIYFTEVDDSNMAGVKCSHYDPDQKRFIADESVCATYYSRSDDNIECICNTGTGVFGLVKTNPNPVRPDPQNPDKDPDPVNPDPTNPDPTKPDPTKPDPTKPDPTKPDPTPNKDGVVQSSYKFVQVFFSIAFVFAGWVGIYIGSLHERVPFPGFDEEKTFHPIYSILRAYTGAITNAERIQMLFLTFLTQLLLEGFFLNQKSNGLDFKAIALGVAISWVANYVWGLLGKVTTGANKEGQSISVFLIIGQVVTLGGIIYGNLQWAKLPELAINSLVSSFIAGIVIDLAVCDTIAAIAATKVPQIGNVLRLRGFSQRELRSNDVYVQQELKPLAK